MEPNKVINTDVKKLHSEERATQLFAFGYGRRWAGSSAGAQQP